MPRFSDIKTSLALAPSTSVETRVPAVSPYLVPALVVSLLLNLVTGGAIVSNYMEPSISRQDTQPAEDTDPYQEHNDVTGNIVLNHLSSKILSTTNFI